MAKLGKGLSAVFGTDIDDALSGIQNSSNSNSKENIMISSIRVNPYQPRKAFDDEKLKELSESIKQHGVIEPLVVRKSVSGYELIAGERRLRASKLAGLKEVPCAVVEMNDDQMMEVALLENIQREDLSPVEEAQGYEALIKKLNYTQEELSKRVSKSRSYITNSLRLLKLPNKVLDMINNNEISMGHARALITLEDEDKIIELASKAAKEGLSVREVEKLSKKNNDKPTKKVKDEDPFLKEVRNNIEKKFNTQVEVTSKTIVIHYNGNDDLNRILEEMDCLDK